MIDNKFISETKNLLEEVSSDDSLELFENQGKELSKDIVKKIVKEFSVAKKLLERFESDMDKALRVIEKAVPEIYDLVNDDYDDRLKGVKEALAVDTGEKDLTEFLEKKGYSIK